MDTDLTPAHSAQRLLEATRDLLAEKPAAELTVREIAARAGVQHTLIRRHFGSRDALLAVVVAGTLAEFSVAVDAAPDLTAALQVGFEQFGGNRALISGMAVLVVGAGMADAVRYPLADAYEAQLLRAGVDGHRTRDTAVVIIALMSGWAVGEQFWLGMAGRHDDPPAGRKMVEHAVWAIVDQAMDETNRTTDGEPS
jgi:TetR/AcrR family transcriptional regulator, repressor for neighboring sulfatase